MALFGPPNVEKLAAKRDLKGLAKALANPDATVRQGAARALEQLGEPKAVPLVVDHLSDKMDSGAFNDAARVLCAMGADAAPVLVDRLQSSPGNDVVYAMALGKIGEANGLGPLLEASRSAFSGLRGSAVAGLGGIGTPAATDRLIEVFHEDPKFDIRAGAALALAGHKLAGAYETFTSSLESDDPATRGLAAAGLGWLGDGRARERLQQLAGNDPDPRVQNSAQSALSDLTVHSH
jgi:HEAT repeat protein